MSAALHVKKNVAIYDEIMNSPPPLNETKFYRERQQNIYNTTIWRVIHEF